MKKCSVIITVYDKYEELNCVLKSLEKQTYKNFEVIIAEDCKKNGMIEFLLKSKNIFSFNIKHVNQEDIGFRKNRILNKAIKVCNSEFIVFLDGDCLVHKKFIENYMKYSNKYDVLYGRRVEMSEEITKKILQLKGDYKIKFCELTKTKSENSWEAFYLPFWFNIKKRKLRLLGSNMGMKKEILYKINGFNEDYEGAGIGEDTDIAWRLLSINVSHKCLKNMIVEYHLYHTRSNRHNSINGEKILEKERLLNRWKTINGLMKLKEKNEKNIF